MFCICNLNPNKNTILLSHRSFYIYKEKEYFLLVHVFYWSKLFFSFVTLHFVQC